MNTKQKATDDQYNDNWRTLTDEFDKIYKSNLSAAKTKEQCEALKEKAKATTPLTIRQLDGILKRCDSLISGEYGNTKTAENMNQTKSGKPA